MEDRVADREFHSQILIAACPTRTLTGSLQGSSEAIHSGVAFLVTRTPLAQGRLYLPGAYMAWLLAWPLFLTYGVGQKSINERRATNQKRAAATCQPATQAAKLTGSHLSPHLSRFPMGHLAPRPCPSRYTAAYRHTVARPTLGLITSRPRCAL